MVSGTKNRSPTVAGSFYPQNKKELLMCLENYFSKTKKIPFPGKFKALIVPHAGYFYSGQTAAWAFKQIPQKTNQHYLLIGPSHSYSLTCLTASPNVLWETPLGKVPHLKPKTTKEICFDELPHLNEHCLEVQLPFLQYLKENFSITCFLTGNLLNEQNIANYFLNNYRDALLIFSSDLSHYLPEREAIKKDRQTIEAILKLDNNYLQTEDNIACGALGISLLLKMANKANWQGKLIYYDTSASASGDKDMVVGYAAIGFFQK